MTCTFSLTIYRSLELQPGKPQTFVVPNDLRITNVALGAELQEENGRTSVKLTYTQPKPSDSDEEDEDEEDEDKEDEDTEDEPISTVLCSLTPGKVCLRCWVFRSSFLKSLADRAGPG